ncbi:TPR and ankyrin repeat-containing protein 1 [Ceratobasidium theobromae]|uniref:TPR and ankyrin repeat-containing protein 1 n=1 Tax=Ceratobasidium theobromae TaxID=1582974 RepID=A0A5N5QLZ9_9AGAM|nr:TPR and ankyrin repeat-containing protein 1 [Ceratobasidium theobromae]
MTRSSRSKSDSRSKSPEISRKSLQLSWVEPKFEYPLQSPTSPLTRKTPKNNIHVEPRPTSPEEWVGFAQKKLYQAEREADGILALAMFEPDLLEYLMTVDEVIREAVSRSICDTSFPPTRAAWVDSLTAMLFTRFQTYLNRLPPELADRTIDEASRQVVPFLNALASLHLFAFETEELQGEEDTFFKSRKKSQKQRKASNATRGRRIAVDPRVFVAINFDEPTSADELLVTEVCLLEHIQKLLKVLLGAFENPKLASHAEALFFRKPLQYVPDKPASTSASTLATSNDSTTLAPDPGAYPHIRPLAAAKYFDEGTGLGAWNIIVSGRAINYLRQMQKRDSHVFAMVHKKITELSQGFFSDSNQKRLTGLDTEVPIYEAKVSRDLRIVYQIDLDTNVDAKVDKQIIKLYGVYTHAQLDNRLWALISHYHINRRGKEYRRRCLHRETPRALGQNVTLPAQFKHEEDMEALVDVKSLLPIPSGDGMTERDFLDLHSLIALEKFIPMSQSLINSILLDSDSSHVFHVSAKEKEIIYHESACFVLGRSGTGKTTSILFKMIGIDKLFDQMEEVTKPRQVFVTQSRVLAQRVREYYQNLVKSSLGTLSKSSKPTEEEEQILADLDDEDADAFGLPPKYSMLEDKHFPLFVTYDQLCSLLEADFGLQVHRSIRTKAHAAAEKRFAIAEIADVKIDLDREVEPELTTDGGFSHSDIKHDVQRARQAAVTFEIFVAAYWPHFDFRLTKGFDPALIYSEFLGIIEGSEAALGSKTGALSREEYTSLSHRKSSFASQRDKVYDLYEIYRKRKQQLGGYDAAERTHALVSAVNAGVPGPKIDCLYVDEAQDNLLIDVKLLHQLSNNPHGIFMAGDTAQTISAGSAFRFEDLKAFMWRLEEQDEAVRCGKRSAIHPALFHLAVNYRSHGGIVDCASSVVQLISDLFPYSIDKLSKETGLIDGPKPIFFSGWDRGVVRFEQFLRGEADTKIDFGASQVILVRHEAARSALRAQVGEIGLILTLYESKGLEFDDVLLYNFFEDSVPSASTWRVILHGLEKSDFGPVPRFDEIRHAVICTELKNLYVGLTRARNHCWIWDISDKAEPMKVFWKRQDLIKLCGPEDPMPQLSVSSSEADWAKSGRLLFNKGLYPQAIFCFDKANLPVERDIAAAYEARKQARLLRAAKSVDRTACRTAFVNAAHDFLRCASQSKGRQQTSCYFRAAECYIQAEDWKSAAEAFLSAKEFDMAARNFRRAGCFDEAVAVVKHNRGQIKDSVAEEVIGVAKLEYLRKAKYEKASELFDDIEEQLEYMEDYGFDVALIHVLEHHKRYDQAADVAFKEHNIAEGVRLLLRSDNPRSVRQAIERALHGLWTLLPFGPFGNKLDNSSITSLINLLSGSKAQVLNESDNLQLEVFKALCTKDINRVMDLARSHGVLAQKNESPIHRVLFLLCSSYGSHLLIPAARNSTIFDFIIKAKLALSYFNQLLQFGRSLDTTSLSTQQLLGFEPMEPKAYTGIEGEEALASTEFWIHSTSIMFKDAQNIQNIPTQTPSSLGFSSLAISELDANRLASHTIYAVLQSEIRTAHTTANLARYLHPCLDFAIFGKCYRSDCERQEVNSFKLLDEQRQEFFNQRARALIIQIDIIHAYQARTHQNELERRDFRRMWARKIYELLMPHFPPLGGILCVERKRIPELDRGSDVISAWCEDALQDLDPGYGAQSKFLSDVLAYLDLAFRVNRQNFAMYAPKLHSRRLVRQRNDLVPLGPGFPKSHSIVHDFIDFYNRRSDDVIQRVTYAINHVVLKRLTIEANVLVHLLEFIGREVIVHFRRWAKGIEGVFDGLLLPQSWALDLVRRPPLMPQRGFVMHDYMNTLYGTLKHLRAHDPNSSQATALYSFSSPLGLVLRSVLIVRICRLLVLLALNIGFDYPAKDLVRHNVARALTGPGDIHNTLFARADSWIDLENAMKYSPLNRGADQLVHISLQRGSNYPRTMKAIKSIVYNTITPELEQLLSLEAFANTSTSLDPEAKPFVPQLRTQKSVGDITEVTESTEATDQADADAIGDLIPPQVDYLEAMLKPQPERDMHSNIESKCGKQFERYGIATLDIDFVIRHLARQLATEFISSISNISNMWTPSAALYFTPKPSVDISIFYWATCPIALSKELRKLAPRIMPGSDALHNIGSLRAKVKQADDIHEKFVQAFGVDRIPASLEEHYRLGVTLILEPPRAATIPNPPKPELNTSDLGDVL